MMAPGWPGLPARWTSSAKVAVATAIEPTSPVWITSSHGILNEIYFPRMDVANIRDVQLLVTSRDGGFWEEKRDLTHHFEYVSGDAPALQWVNEEPSGRFRIIKRVVTWPSGASVVQLTKFTALRGDAGDYRVFLLVAPHIGNQGGDNSASTIRLRQGRPASLAWRESTHLCVTSSQPFVRQSVGFVGTSDGWTALRDDGTLTEYDRAEHGNVAMTAELDFGHSDEQMIVLSFGRSRGEAVFNAELTLLHDYRNIEAHFIQGWHDYFGTLSNLLPEDKPHARLQRVSAMVLKIHHGKLFPGGMVASLSIPWGQVCGDGNVGGYHLVWPRDLVEAAQSFIALGDWNAARQVMLFLMATQQDDGSWAQNFWLDGTPYWPGSQLDETAFPIHLAYRLHQLHAMRPREDLYPTVKRAMAYLVQAGPVTQQERWEEDGGYSPATLAAAISALVMGAELARERNEETVAQYAESVADYWRDNLDRWTFTTQGPVNGQYPRHYIRIHTDFPQSPDGHVGQGWIPITNRPPGAVNTYPEVAVIDGGFLELVRYGVKAADDPRIVESVAAYDGILRREMPYGPLWYRYNHDGYGEQADGSPYQGAGQGRLWPLLAGERGHYALALGEDVELYLKAMEGAASEGGLIPEQVWDTDDIPERELFFGRPSGSAMPLVWAHAEYVKLLYSSTLRHVFEMPNVVRDRYQNGNAQDQDLVFWQFNHQRREWSEKDQFLRVAVGAPAQLIYTRDHWAHVNEATLTNSGLGMYFTDIPLSGAHQVEFTFYWTEAHHWEGRNFSIHAAQGSADAD